MWIEKLDDKLFKEFLLIQYDQWLAKKGWWLIEDSKYDERLDKISKERALAWEILKGSGQKEAS